LRNSGILFNYVNIGYIFGYAEYLNILL